ncbi:MAG TPA: hypothetical protein VFV52_13080 [Bacilli bacterium]|nr:hypothetical protein [Bacilli bacterium]
MPNPMWKKTTLLVLSLAAILTTNGCAWQVNAPEAEEVEQEAPVQRQISTDGWDKILNAIEKNQSVENFGIKSEFLSTVNGTSHRAAIYGHVTLPDQAVLSENIDGRAYYLFQDENHTYWREEDVWQEKFQRVSIPNTWASLERMKELAPQKLYQLPDAILVSFPAEVFQFEANAVSIAGMPAPDNKALPARYTFYVDKATHYLKRIEIDYTDHLEGKGTVVGHALIDYFDFSDESSVKMTDELQKAVEKLKP